jgi:integrase
MATKERGIYERQTKRGKVYDAVATVQNRQKWSRGHVTIKAAKAARDEMAVSMRTGQMGQAPARLTLGEYIEKRWLPSKLPDLGSEAQRHYTYMAHLISERLGHIRLAQLAPLDIEGFKAGLRASGTRNANTQHLIFFLLSQALRQAVRWGLIYRNPADQVTPPRKVKREPPLLEMETIKRLLAAADNSAYGALVFMAMMTGMRFGELVALHWSDIDMATGVLRIPKSKTPKGVRAVGLGPVTLARLQTHRLEQMRFFTEKGAPPPPLVFLTPIGAQLDQGNFHHKWKEIIDAAAVKLRFHDLRHVQATLLARAGVHPRVAQERLGHADSKMTLDVYTHLTVGDQLPAAAAVEELLGG